MASYWKQLSFLVVLFFLIIILIQASSWYLFYSYYLEAGIEAYYFGKGELGSKTIGGLLEVIIPHLASQAIVLFLLSHFLVLFSGKKKLHDQVAIGLLVSAFLNIFAGPLVLMTGIGYIKIFTYILFQIFFTLSLYLIFKSFIFSHFKSETKVSRVSL